MERYNIVEYNMDGKDTFEELSDNYDAFMENINELSDTLSNPEKTRCGITASIEPLAGTTLSKTQSVDLMTGEKISYTTIHVRLMIKMSFCEHANTDPIMTSILDEIDNIASLYDMYFV